MKYNLLLNIRSLLIKRKFSITNIVIVLVFSLFISLSVAPAQAQNNQTNIYEKYNRVYASFNEHIEKTGYTNTNGSFTLGFLNMRSTLWGVRVEFLYLEPCMKPWPPPPPINVFSSSEIRDINLTAFKLQTGLQLQFPLIKTERSGLTFEPFIVGGLTLIEDGTITGVSEQELSIEGAIRPTITAGVNLWAPILGNGLVILGGVSSSYDFYNQLGFAENESIVDIDIGTGNSVILNLGLGYVF